MLVQVCSNGVTQDTNSVQTFSDGSVEISGEIIYLLQQRLQGKQPK